MPKFDDDPKELTECETCFGTCDGCRFWSELIAHATPDGVAALCLNKQSTKYQQYTITGCELKEEGATIDLEAVR